MKAQELAQWVIDNRYPKSEKEKISDFEMYNFIIDKYQSTETHSDVMQALADVRAEEMQKGMIFGEWANKCSFKYDAFRERWEDVGGYIYYTSELYASYEFDSYYQQRRMKS